MIKKNKVSISIASIALLVVCGFLYAATIGKDNTNVIIQQNIVYEYGSIVEGNQLAKTIIDYENSILPSAYSIEISNVETHNITDSSIGRLTLITEKKVYEKEFEYSVSDTQFPTIRGVKDLETEYDTPIDFEELLIGEDSVDGEVAVTVEGEIDYKQTGTYELAAIAIDSNGNETKENFVVTVKEKVVVATPKETNTSNKGNAASTGDKTTTGGNTASTDGNTAENKPYCEGSGVYYNGKEFCKGQHPTKEGDVIVKTAPFINQGFNELREWALNIWDEGVYEGKLIEYYQINYVIYTDGSKEYVVIFKYM